MKKDSASSDRAIGGISFSFFFCSFSDMATVTSMIIKKIVRMMMDIEFSMKRCRYASRFIEKNVSIEIGRSVHGVACFKK